MSKKAKKSASLTPPASAPVLPSADTQADTATLNPPAPPAPSAQVEQATGTVQNPPAVASEAKICPTAPAMPSDEVAAARKARIDALYDRIAAHREKDAAGELSRPSIALASLSALWDLYAETFIIGPTFNYYANTSGKSAEAKAARLPWVKYLAAMNGDLSKAKDTLVKWQIAYFGETATTAKFSRSKHGVFTARQTSVSKVKAAAFTRISV